MVNPISASAFVVGSDSSSVENGWRAEVSLEPVEGPGAFSAGILGKGNPVLGEMSEGKEK